ncbi:MAG TPA: glycosyltransferase family 2 protein [Terracidiphilus sp.]|nr:glycosyltransferase family 2 protein [Terracidiphilus sp.]
MRISVVVPTYNRRTIVLRTLERLFRQSCPAEDYEIVVVVDGSADGTVEALRALDPPCDFRVVVQKNRGLAGARNTGFRVAEGEVVLFVDDDMLCDPELVAAHLQAHRQDDGIVGIGALFLSEESPPSLAAECFRREIGAAHLQARAPADTSWRREDCVFSNSSLRREMLIDLGGFDEGFRMREDLEFGARLFSVGIRPVYLARAIAHQFYDKSSADLICDSEAFAVSDVLLARKHPDLRLQGHVSWLRIERGWKHRLRCLAARQPALADALLIPVCALCERFLGVPALRHMGMRALQIRRRLHWMHKVMELERGK